MISSLYVCQLPQDKQDAIAALAKERLSVLGYPINIEEEVNNVLNSRLTDITELISYDELVRIVDK